MSKGGCTIKSSSTTTASPKAGLGLGLGLGQNSFKYHGVCWCLTMYAILSGYREVCLYNTRQDIQHDCALVCLETSSPLKITPNTYSVQLNPGSSLPPPPPKKERIRWTAGFPTHQEQQPTGHTILPFPHRRHHRCRPLRVTCLVVHKFPQATTRENVGRCSAVVLGVEGIGKGKG